MPKALDLDSLIDAGLSGTYHAPDPEIDSIIDAGLSGNLHNNATQADQMSVIARVVAATGDPSWYERPRTEALIKYHELGLDAAVPPSNPEDAMAAARSEGQQAQERAQALDEDIGALKGFGEGATFGISNIGAHLANPYDQSLSPESTAGKIGEFVGGAVGGLVPGNFVGEAIPAIKNIANPVLRGGIEGGIGGLTYWPAQEVERGLQAGQVPSLGTMSLDALLNAGLGFGLGAGIGRISPEYGQYRTQSELRANPVPQPPIITEAPIPQTPVPMEPGAMPEGYASTANDIMTAGDIAAQRAQPALLVQQSIRRINAQPTAQAMATAIEQEAAYLSEELGTSQDFARRLLTQYQTTTDLLRQPEGMHSFIPENAQGAVERNTGTWRNPVEGRPPPSTSQVYQQALEYAQGRMKTRGAQSLSQTPIGPRQAAEELSGPEAADFAKDYLDDAALNRQVAAARAPQETRRAVTAQGMTEGHQPSLPEQVKAMGDMMGRVPTRKEVIAQLGDQLAPTNRNEQASWLLDAVYGPDYPNLVIRNQPTQSPYFEPPNYSKLPPRGEAAAVPQQEPIRGQTQEVQNVNQEVLTPNAPPSASAGRAGPEVAQVPKPEALKEDPFTLNDGSGYWIRNENAKAFGKSSAAARLNDSNDPIKQQFYRGLKDGQSMEIDGWKVTKGTDDVGRPMIARAEPVAQGGTNAIQEQSPAAMDVRQETGNGPEMGTGNTVDQGVAKPGTSKEKIIQLNSGVDPQQIVDAVRTGAAKLRDAGIGEGAKMMLADMAGRTAPRLTASNRETGETAAELAASKGYAIRLAAQRAREVLGNVAKRVLGTILTEDNLRSIKQRYLDNGEQTLADRVWTAIGKPNSPFKTEAEYQAALRDPEIQAAIKRHKELVNPEMNEMFKIGADLPADAETPTRGQQTGARSNLLAIRGEEPAAMPKPSGGSSGNPQNLFPRKTPFANEATGLAKEYDLDYDNILANTYGKQMWLVNQKRFYQALVDGGDALAFGPGQEIPRKLPELKGEPLVKVVPTVPAKTTLFVRRGLVREVRGVLDQEPKGQVWGLTHLAKALNWLSIQGITDATSHGMNIFGVGLSQPGIGGDAVREALSYMGLGGNAGVLIERLVTKAVQAATHNPEAEARLTYLAKINALRESEYSGIAGKALGILDKSMRLVMDDAYTFLVEHNLAADTDTARREFINQVGQYNRLVMPRIMRAFRESGVAPFVVAGKEMNALAFRRVFMGSGAEPASKAAGVALRAMTAAKWAGTIGTVMLVNKAMTGSVFGRPGTKFLDIDWGKDDAQGRHITSSIWGYSRMLRTTGIEAAIESAKKGKSVGESIDSVVKDVASYLIHPFAGPAVKFGTAAAFGRSPTRPDLDFEPKVPPGTGAIPARLDFAARESIPTYNAARTTAEPNKSWWDVASALGGSLSPKATVSTKKAEAQPKAEHFAKLKEFEEWVVREARKLPVGERAAFIYEQAKKMEPSDRAQMLTKRRNQRLPEIIQRATKGGN